MIVIIVVVVGIFQLISMMCDAKRSAISVHRCGGIGIERGTHSLPGQRILFRFWMLVTHSIFENCFQTMQIFAKPNLREFRINLIDIERCAAIAIIIAEC